MSIETILEALPQLTREQRRAILDAAKEEGRWVYPTYLELFRIRKGMELLLETKLEMEPD